MFPGANAIIDRNEACEPIGWDVPSEPDMGDVEADFYERYFDEGDDEDDDTFIGSETSAGGQL